MLIPLLIALILSFGVLIFFVGMGLAAMAHDPLDGVLQQYGAGPRSLREQEMSRPFDERVLRPLLLGVAGFVQRFTPQSHLESMRKLLGTAGNPNDWTVADLLGLRGLAAIVFGGLTILLLNWSTAGFLLRPALILSMSGIGFQLPLFWLRWKANAYQTEIRNSLPDALDLLAISLEAGIGLDAAIQRVTQKWDNALSDQLARVLSEVQMGSVRRDALRDMANRIDVSDVTNFVAAVVQAEQMGASVTNVIRTQSEQMRVIRRQRAQEAAQRAPIKMLFPLLFFIFPAMFIVILGPALLRLLGQNLFGR